MVPIKHSRDTWREALKIISRCPICGSTYRTEEARLFAQNDAASLVHITCHECRSYFVAMIVMLGAGLSSVGMVTDLNFDDAKRLYKVEPLTIDEMIEGYQKIQVKEFVEKNLVRLS